MRRTVVSLAVVAVAAVAAMTIGSSSATGLVSFSFAVHPGAAPVLSADDVEGLARAQFERLAALAGKPPTAGTAVATAVLGADLTKIEADAPVFDALTLPPSATVWVVRANTVFASDRGPTGEVREWDSGNLIFDASSGDLLGLGMP